MFHVYFEKVGKAYNILPYLNLNRP